MKLRIRITLLIAFLLVLCSAGSAQTSTPSHTPTVVFMTDFGHLDDAVPICKGVMLNITPDLRIVDLTHDVTPFNILEASRYLAGTAPYFPANTVFVVVVDPGVGSTRKAIVAHTKRGEYFVAPDNGVLTLVDQQDPIDATYEITNPAWMIGSALSSTFHGRDIFAPVGSHLARGEDPKGVGPEINVKNLVRLNVVKATVDSNGLNASIIGTDGPFGNLVTNVARSEFAELGYKVGDTVKIVLDGKSYELPFMKTFSDVAVGSPLLYIDSRGRLGLAVNQKSFAEQYHIKPPTTLLVQRKTANR
jgi:S-adenosyl-L-methionine hydrolase (adenosine-forming)